MTFETVSWSYPDTALSVDPIVKDHHDNGQYGSLSATLGDKTERSFIRKQPRRKCSYSRRRVIL